MIFEEICPPHGEDISMVTLRVRGLLHCPALGPGARLLLPGLDPLYRRRSARVSVSGPVAVDFLL